MAPEKPDVNKMKEAYLYKKLQNGKVRCDLCNHRCSIEPGKTGICRVRENRGGTLYSLVYGKAIATNIDPVEKKPLFHFLPGSDSFSIATAGCNFRCRHCQNSDISQVDPESSYVMGRQLPPRRVVDYAVEYKCKSISYTYTEPTIFMEYAYDTARIAREEGIKNAFVTNGCMTEESLKFFHPYLEAANVDLKAYSDDFYRQVCNGTLAPVLANIKTMKELGVWVEVTTLLIPGMNDSPEEIKQIARFINSVDAGIPWHISRFHPAYKMSNIPPTPAQTLHKAREIGKQAGLRYVYTGNLPGDDGENTYCYNCGKLLITRNGFQITENRISGAKCPDCGVDIDGVFQ